MEADTEKNVPAHHSAEHAIVVEDRLRRSLSPRQVQMIAIGGTIGTGLFLGTGKALATGGPASLLICYAIVGAIVFVTMLCLGEMAAFVPVAGSFCSFSARYVDDAWGFALTWNYWFNDAVSTAADLVALQLLLQYWTDTFPWYALGLIVWFLLVLANAINVRAYGELEYWLCLLKVVTIVIFIILSIVVNCGVNTSHEYIGARNWYIPGAPFVGGIGGFASVFVTASFAYGGTESIAITAGETKDPARQLPRVVKNVFWRILFFYILSALMIGLNVPYNYPNLNSKETRTSPFTIAFQLAGSKVAGSFMNAVILTSVISAGNHALFAGSRLLYTLSVNGHAPEVFSRLTRFQVPWVSVLFTSVISGLLFGASFIGAGQLWTWLQNLVGVSNQLSWISIGIASLRFRAGLKAQGKEHLLPFKNWTYPVGPIIAIALNIFIVLVQGWSCFSPSFSPVDFVSYYIELPLFALMFVAWKLVKRTKFKRAGEMDLVTDVYTKDDIEPEEHGWTGRAKRIGAKGSDAVVRSSQVGADGAECESAVSLVGQPADGSVNPADESHRTVLQGLKGFYERNLGLFFVFMAQVFASLMTMTTRLLETGFETKFHALQIIVVRMLATSILGSLYMWYKKVPDFPLGRRDIRGLLVLRGLAGFTGLSCSYYSLSYLNLSDATVISFLVPTMTAFICFVALKEPFTAREAMAGFIAFAGVLFIARPTFLFPNHEEEQPEAGVTGLFIADRSTGIVPSVPATPAERTLAALLAVIGTFGAAAAYSTIRVIGKRAHSLVSVNYFAVLATVGSFLIIVVHPDLHFEIPQNITQWSLLVAIGIAGFLLQFLLTEGLQREKAGRATNLIYTQMVFALILERVVWGTTPPAESLFGSALIMGSAIWVSLQKNKVATKQKSPVIDEERSLLGASTSEDDHGN
ncbi:Basic amino-acid permease [Parahypoxylon ruwenzoriense]